MLCRYVYCLPSVLWRCWLGGRKSIRPVKKEWWGAGVVICLERVADLHMAQLMPLPLTVSCFSKVQIGFTFLVLAHPGSPGQRAVKRMCVCVCILYFEGKLCRQTMFAFSALTLLVGRHEGPKACKNWVVGCWHGCLSGTRCKFAYGPADATATHLFLASVKSRLVLPFWYCSPDSQTKAIKCVCVCICILYNFN